MRFFFTGKSNLLYILRNLLSGKPKDRLILFAVILRLISRSYWVFFSCNFLLLSICYSYLVFFNFTAWGSCFRFCSLYFILYCKLLCSLISFWTCLFYSARIWWIRTSSVVSDWYITSFNFNFQLNTFCWSNYSFFSCTLNSVRLSFFSSSSSSEDETD